VLRRLLLLLGTIAAVLGVASTAWASWGSHGVASGTATTSALNPPTAVTALSGISASVHVTWTAATGTPTSTGYYVMRISDASGSATAACGTSSGATITATACDDQSVADGSYHYIVTGIYHTWTATSAASNSVGVHTPKQLAFTGQPATTTAGTAISPAVAVTVQDVFGNAVAAAGISVTVAIGTNPGAGTLSGQKTASTNSSGVATFSSLSIDKAATGYRLAATSSGLTAATSGTFTITAAAATQFAITSSPVSGAAASTATLGPITVQEQDAFGNPVSAPAGGRVVTLTSDSTGPKVFAATAGGVSAASVTIPAGSSSVTFFYGDRKAAVATLTVSGSLTSATQVATITAAAPASLCITVNPTCTGGTTISIQKGATADSTVSLRDAFGNVATATSSVSVAVSRTGNGTVTGSPLTVAAGQSTSGGSFRYTADNGANKAGTVTATASGLTSATVTFTT
jgi:hypothetical protein